MGGITLLEVLDDAQRVHVVVESPSMSLQATVQRALTRMTKRRMTDIVNQRQRLRQIFVQAKRCGDGACNLGYLNRVGQAAAKMIRSAAGKYLRLARQTPKGAGLHNAFAVPLERRSRSTRRRGIDAGQKEIVRVSRDRASMEIDCHSQI